MAINIEIKPDESTGLASVVISGIDISRILQKAKQPEMKDPARYIRDKITDAAAGSLANSRLSAAQLSIQRDEIQRTIDAIPSIVVKL